MHAFRAGSSGYVTRMDSTERAIIGRVVADVAQLLGFDVAEDPGGRADAGTADGDADLPVIDWGSVGEAADDGDDAASTSPAESARLRQPIDPALARLLPTASEDEEIAGEVRKLTEESIRTAKGRRLQRVWWDLQTPSRSITVPGDAAMEWAGALTDVRLVLAQRLGVEDADDASALESVAHSSPDDVTRALATLYLALSWLQESLVEAMLDEIPDSPEDGDDARDG